ncbi:MAG: hypothetical protein PVG40_07370 [Desulfobacterales bacterium]
MVKRTGSGATKAVFLNFRRPVLKSISGFFAKLRTFKGYALIKVLFYNRIIIFSRTDEHNGHNQITALVFHLSAGAFWFWHYRHRNSKKMAIRQLKSESRMDCRAYLDFIWHQASHDITLLDRQITFIANGRQAHHDSYKFYSGHPGVIGLDQPAHSVVWCYRGACRAKPLGPVFCVKMKIKLR